MQSLQHIEETTFIGQNDKFPSHLLPKGVFQLVQNALVDNNRITKRPGSTAIAASLGAFSILGLSEFEPAGGTKYIIACRDGGSNAQLYSSTGGVFSSIGSANLQAAAQMHFVEAANKLWGFNGVEVVDVDSALTVTRNRAGVPKGTFAFWYHNYLFIGGVTANPNRLYWSALGDPTTFSGSDFVDINANDGDVLTGLNSLNDELIVFKNFSIWAITGWSGSSFAATTQTGQNTLAKAAGVGTPSHESIINTGKDVYFLAFVGGIPHIRSLVQTSFSKVLDAGVVSFDIETTMNGLNKTQLAKACAVYDGKYIYWAVPNGSSTTNNLVLVLYPSKTFNTNLGTLHSWVTWTGQTPSQYTVSTISGRAKVYYGDATTGGLVSELNTSVFTDNGVAVSMTINSRDIAFDQTKKTKYKYLYLKYRTGSAGTLGINARIDQAANFGVQRNLSLAGMSPGLGPTGSFTLGVSQLGGSATSKTRVTFAQLTGTLLGIQFTEATANSCELYDYSIWGFTRALRNS